MARVSSGANGTAEHVKGTGSTQTNGITNGTSRMKLARKQSNPLAPPFIVSAPGKTIVYGEHAVVHGRAAIAASISLRSYLCCTTLTKSQRTVTLHFADIGLNYTWDIPDLPWKAFNDPAKKKKYYDLVTSLDQDLVDTLRPHIAKVGASEEARMRKVHQDAANAFLYLFLSLGSEDSPPCKYALRSAVPIGAGLGSSASVSVCLAVALLLQCRALSGPHPDQQSRESEEQLERINRWAFVGEMLIHGNPSGVDNTVSTHGHAALFQRTDYQKPPDVSILRDFPELPLLLVDTRQSRSTSVEVAKVGDLKTAHPQITEHILDAIDAITRSAYDHLTADNVDPKSLNTIRHLGELMTLNHDLLSTLGVSHPRLERLRQLVAESGVGWVKLTGAGGGGCAIVLLKPDAVVPPLPDGSDAAARSKRLSESPAPSQALQSLQRRLAEEGFAQYTTTLGGDGVGVLFPAILNDEEIDQEMFLAAEGREGVEALVGGDNYREAWKYWRP